MKAALIKLAILSILFASAKLNAQIANDDFADAIQLVIPNNGYALDTAKSSFFNLANATIETNEFIDSIPNSKGLNASSAWFWFEVPTARSVRIDLKPRLYNVNPQHAGLAIYYDSENIPNKAKLTQVFPSIPRFGSSINSCTKPGRYYIQVLGHKNLNEDVTVHVITRQSPQAPVFDHPKTAKQMGTISGMVTERFEAGCLSKDSNDHVCVGDSDLTQSAWFTFKTSKSPTMFRMQLADLVNKRLINNYKFYVFEGNCRKSLGTLPIVYSCSDSGDLSCMLKPETIYSINLLMPKDLDAHVGFILLSRGMGKSIAANRKALPKTVSLGKIDSLPFDKRYTEYIDCNSRMANYSGCSPIIKDTFIGSNFYKYHSLLTFTTADSSVLRYDGQFYSDLSGAKSFVSGGELYRVFRGNIEDSCNLEFMGYVSEHNPLCLSPGAYTVQTILRESASFTPLGCEANFNLKVDALVQQQKGVHTTPLLIETLDTLSQSPSASGSRDTIIHSLPDYFDSPDTFFNLPSGRIYGRFVFRKFYLDTPGKVIIKSMGSPLTEHYIFKGEADKNNLSMITIKFNNYTFTDQRAFDTKCENLDAGWYTIIGVLDEMNCLSRDHLITSSITAELVNIHPSNFNYANKAHLVNNLSPLRNTDSSGNVFRSQTYNLPQGYFDCKKDSPFHYPSNCAIGSQEFAYYVFTVAQNSYVTINSDGASAQLFPYNIQVDSAKINNATAIDPCRSQNRYCNVVPGVYTLVLNGESRSHANPTITLSPSIKTPNDVLSKSMNMGRIKTGTNKSKAALVGCQIGYHNTDYPISIRRNYGESIGTKKLTGHTYAGDQFGNIWFTFTIDEPGEVIIGGEATHTFFNSLTPLVVYEAADDQNFGPDTLSILGRLDSTQEQGLIPIDLETTTNFRFNKASCKKKRYYVLVSAIHSLARPNGEVQLEVDFTPVKHEGDLSDYCSNAKTIILGDNDAGKQTVNIACHTLGESYGEDGSNLSCLGRKKDIKTSWIKLKINGNTVNDLTLTLTENTTALPQEISFRVLEGTCNKMTPGHCFSEVTGGYKLDCMPNQTYYIQISTPKEALGTIEVSAKTTVTKNQFCNSSYGKGIRAEFEASMGCYPDDSIQLKITGTQGDSIRHEWIIDSTKTINTNEAITRLDGSQLGTQFYVKLITATLDSSEADTAEQWIYKEEAPNFNAGKDVIGACIGSLTTNPQLNFVPDEIKWYPEELFEFNDILKAKFTLESFDTIYIIAKAYYGDCEYEDTIEVINQNLNDSITDIDLCPNDSMLVYHNNNSELFYWEDNSQRQERFLSTAGTYVLTKGESKGCINKFIYNVSVFSELSYSIHDTLICLGQRARIKLPNNSNYSIKWDNGDTTTSKIINTEGNHLFEIEGPNGCKVVDTVKIDASDFPTAELSDTFVCETPLNLDPEIDNAFYTWSTGETTRSINVVKSGNYSVDIEKAGCNFSAEANVAFTEILELQFNDTAACDSQIFIQKPDKPNFEYTWLNTETTGPDKYIVKSGEQRIEVTERHCKRFFSFNVNLIRHPVINLGGNYNSCLPFTDTLTVDSVTSSVLWSTGSTNRSIIVSDTGSYWVRASNGMGCDAFEEIYIGLEQDCFRGMKIPNVFTPHNLDNKNDFFKPSSQPLEEYNLTIFNRWGQQVFESNSLEQGWNGHIKGRPATPGVYYYLINYKPFGEDGNSVYGSVNLIR